jgi:hypothetical protein
MLAEFLQKYNSLFKMDPAFTGTRPNMGLVINAAEADKAVVYEWSASYDTKIRTGSGLLASSNHYIDPSWQGLQPIGDGEKYGYTRERLANLLALGEKHKGKINAAMMMQIMDTALPDGGPTFRDDKNVTTYYQLVVMPSNLTIWLKAAGWSGWEKMDLRLLLK